MRLSKRREKEEKQRQREKRRMPNDKIKYKIVKLNKNRKNIFAPLMQLRCCQEDNLPSPLPCLYPPLCPPQAALPAEQEQLLCICFVGTKKKICVINERVGEERERGRKRGARGSRELSWLVSLVTTLTPTLGK